MYTQAYHLLCVLLAPQSPDFLSFLVICLFPGLIATWHAMQPSNECNGPLLVQPGRHAQGMIQSNENYATPRLLGLVPSAGLHQHTQAAASTEHKEHLTSLAHLFPDNYAIESKQTIAKSSNNVLAELGRDVNLNLFVDPSKLNDILAAIRSWTNLFAVAEITSPTAEYSMFSPRSMPFIRSDYREPLFLHYPELPGLTRSSLNPYSLPPYYRTSDAAAVWEPNILPEAADAHDSCGVRGDDVSSEVNRKRSRKFNHVQGQHDARGNGAVGAACKLLRAPQNDAPFSSSNRVQESCCKTSDGTSPVVDVFVPSFCACGTAIVGVWYRNHAYYTRWFRHPRYAALRSVLQHNRCKEKSQPTCCNVSQPSFVGSVVVGDAFGAVASSDELLAPKFMSLLCMLQLVKRLDISQLMHPTSIPISPDIASTKISMHNLKLSAHIGCEGCDGFAQYRWYCEDTSALINQLVAGDRNTTKVVGCCCLHHWKCKPPGRNSSESV